jgi:hypothetical protein
MNERIQQLAEQAGIYKLNLSDETEYWIMEKFAELIVAECAEIADMERSNSVGCGYITKTNGMRIKEHFGVEE